MIVTSVEATTMRHHKMRTLLILSCCLSSAAGAAIAIDPGFWESYEPYQQYSRETLRDLAVLREGDLLETARDIDGLELRVVGRSSRSLNLVSARLVIDSMIGRRLQVKVVPFELSPNRSTEPTMHRRPVSAAQADALIAMLERRHFWEASYSTPAPDAGSLDCSGASQWIIEAVRPGTYQLIARTACGGLDPAAAEIRDFLLDLADISAVD